MLGRISCGRSIAEVEPDAVAGNLRREPMVLIGIGCG
jgi:hypothetical protein